MTDGTVMFCFGLGGSRDEIADGYHPCTLYREDGNPYDVEDADEKIRRALDALPKPPEEYGREDAGRGGWVRFDYGALVSGEDKTPIEVTDE